MSPTIQEGAGHLWGIIHVKSRIGSGRFIFLWWDVSRTPQTNATSLVTYEVNKMKYTCNIQLKLKELCCKSSPSTSCYPFFFSKNHADYNLSAQYLHHVSVRTVIAVFCKLLDKYYTLLCYRWVTIRDSFIIIKYSMPLTSRSLLARWPISLPLACVFHMYMLRIT